MARWAIGDIQGCLAEFEELLAALRFNPDRDRLWLTGDLVNRGPESLGVLRRIYSLRDNLQTVLGNHDLHLLALAIGSQRKPRRKDTLDAILVAADRDRLLAWLVQQPLVHFDGDRNELLVHAGLVPQWSASQALQLAREVERALQSAPGLLFDSMYGDQPDHWDERLSGNDRLRFIVNVCTRLRACSAAGRVDLRQKGAPEDIPAPLLPWFEINGRASSNTRVIFGHWSALGFLQRPQLLAIDTGCVWGGSLTAVNLDDPARPPVSVASHQPISRGD